MAKDTDALEPPDLDLPEELDDDVGGDWESAFQAEDFMLSPDEEPDDFFVTEEGSEEEEDLASLLDTDDTQQKSTTKAGVDTPGQTAAGGKDKSAAAVSFFTNCQNWFLGRPTYQKILLPALALLPILLFSATLFFRSTTQQLAENDNAVSEEKMTAAAESEMKQKETIPQMETQTPPAVTSFTEPVLQNRKKWSIPAFLIAVQKEQGQENIVVKVDITLVLQLKPGQSVPEAKLAFVRDAIYQFYTNRPVAELRHYSLARGEMIRNLSAWLKHQWPENPIASIIFNRYQILK